MFFVVFYSWHYNAFKRHKQLLGKRYSKGTRLTKHFSAERAGGNTKRRVSQSVSVTAAGEEPRTTGMTLQRALLFLARPAVRV